jgi:hypothetical protein
MLITIFPLIGMIRSLQSKVKRLKEERERSISGEANPAAVKAEEDEEPAAGKGSLEDDAAGGEDRVSGGESGRSCRESNSSDLKRPVNDAGTASAAGDGAAAMEEGEEEATAAGVSVDVKREEVSGESVAGSKEADKESSDVQSSASPSRRREREGGGGGEGGEEAETEEASASPSARAALPAAEAEALLAFVESVRTSKPGSVFERRLESQVKKFNSPLPFVFLHAVNRKKREKLTPPLISHLLTHVKSEITEPSKHKRPNRLSEEYTPPDYLATCRVLGT